MHAGLSGTGLQHGDHTSKILVAMGRGPVTFKLYVLVYSYDYVTRSM